MATKNSKMGVFLKTNEQIIAELIRLNLIDSSEDFYSFYMKYNSLYNSWIFQPGINCIRVYQKTNPSRFLETDELGKLWKLVDYVRYGDTSIMCALNGVSRYADFDDICEILGLKKTAGKAYLKKLRDLKIVIKVRIIDFEAKTYHYEYKINPIFVDKTGAYGFQYVDFCIFNDYIINKHKGAIEYLWGLTTGKEEIEKVRKSVDQSKNAIRGMRKDDYYTNAKSRFKNFGERPINSDFLKYIGIYDEIYGTKEIEKQVIVVFSDTNDLITVEKHMGGREGEYYMRCLPPDANVEYDKNVFAHLYPNFNKVKSSYKAMIKNNRFVGNLIFYKFTEDGVCEIATQGEVLK